MPQLRKETFQGAGDFRWLRSDHAIWNGRTEALNVAAFTKATHYPDGFIKSGTPCALIGTGTSAVLEPYDSAEATTTARGVLAGHILGDQRVVEGGDAVINVALLDHGRVNPAYVPQGVQAFVPPVAAAKSANHTVVYR